MQQPRSCIAIAYLAKKIQAKDEVLSELMAEHMAVKETPGNSDGVRVPHGTRRQIVDSVLRWSEKLRSGRRFIAWLDIIAQHVRRDDRRLEGYVEHYNNVRLNSATCHISPNDTLDRQHAIHRERGGPDTTGDCRKQAA